MIYDFIIFSGGVTCGYVLTKTGYADKFVDNMYKKYKDNENIQNKKGIFDRWLSQKPPYS